MLRGGRHLPELYLAIALVVTLLLSLLTPAFYVPDEEHHAERALVIAQGQWEIQPSSQGVGGRVNDGVLALAAPTNAVLSHLMSTYSKASQYPDGRFSEETVRQQAAARWSSTSTFTNFQNVAIYPPTLYLPQLAGWMLGQHAQLSVLNSLRLARLIVALCAIALGWFALRLASAGWRPALFCLLLLPTVLSLNASCAQDAMLFSLASLAMALLSRALAERRTQTLLELLVTTLALLLCIGDRTPYVLLLFALFLPVLESQSARAKRFLAPSIAIGLALLVTLLWHHAILAVEVFKQQGSDPAVQLAFLKSHPLQGLSWIVIGTLKAAPGLAAKGVFVIGMNDAFPPRAVYMLLFLGALGVLFLHRGQALRTLAGRLLVATVLFAIMFGVSLAAYLMWNPVASHAVNGLQSRYYLPLIPFALLLLGKDSKAQIEERWARLYVPSIVLFLVGVFSTPFIAAHRFYGTGLASAMGHLLR